MKQFLKKLFLGESFDNTPASPGALQKHRQNIRNVWNNAMHNDIGVERLFRLFLLCLLYCYPGLYIREILGKVSRDARNLGVEFYVIFKFLFPVLLLITGWYRLPFCIFLVGYFITETITYLTSLIFLADIFPKLRSIRRSLFLLFLNYLEIVFDFAVFYSGLNLLKGNAHSLLDHIYFSVITSATIGYGDISPGTDAGKVLASVQAVLFLIFVVLFLNFFGSKVDEIGYTQKD